MIAWLHIRRSFSPEVAGDAALLMTRWRDLRGCQDTAAVLGMNPRDVSKAIRVPFRIHLESERCLDGATGTQPAERH